MTYNSLALVAHELELEQPSIDIQKHVNMQVTKKMTELGIMDLKQWIREYIVQSRCFPTENTFRNFETKIVPRHLLDTFSGKCSNRHAIPSFAKTVPIETLPCCPKPLNMNG